MNNHPPQWADRLLRVLLAPANRESVSGDLLEEYRDSIVPARGRRLADVWYVAQVAGFVWRATGFWVLAFSAAFLMRAAYDRFVPTTDFAARSTVTTLASVAILAGVGFGAAWRSRSFVAGIVAAALTSQIAAVLSVTGATLMLAFWHDPGTMRAIEGSGGLSEVYTLPFMMILPAVIVGAVGGIAGSVSRRVLC